MDSFDHYQTSNAEATEYSQKFSHYSNTIGTLKTTKIKENGSKFTKFQVIFHSSGKQVVESSVQ